MPTRNARLDAAIRFEGDVRALIGGDLTGRFGVAVSGGPDSVALLLLAHWAFEGRVEAATVDHRLRAASRAEANGVAGLCRKMGVPHARLAIAAFERGNVSARARAARYDALDDWVEARGLDWLMTAHHADDQIETFVMRLNRGAGVGGLSGVRRRRGRILRPLLGWRHAELVALVRSARIKPVDDPSNHDDRYDRARLRKVLTDIDWLDPLAVAHSASALSEADEALDWTVLKLRAERLQRSGTRLTYDAAGLPPELARRALADCLALAGMMGEARGPAIDRMLDRLRAGKAGTLGGVAASADRDRWTFAPAPARRATA